MFRLDFHHRNDLVHFLPWQSERLNDRGAAFLEVYFFKLGRQLGTLWQKFGCKMTYLGVIVTKLVAKLSPAIFSINRFLEEDINSNEINSWWVFLIKFCDLVISCYIYKGMNNVGLPLLGVRWSLYPTLSLSV